MRTIVKICTLLLAVSIVTACCDRRCGVCAKENAKPVTIQERLIKIKQEAGGKGPK